MLGYEGIGTEVRGISVKVRGVLIPRYEGISAGKWPGYEGITMVLVLGYKG